MTESSVWLPKGEQGDPGPQGPIGPPGPQGPVGGPGPDAAAFVQFTQDLANQSDPAKGAALTGHNGETVADALDRAGVDNQWAFGNVKQNGTDYATLGPNLLPALAGFTKVNFDALGNHSAGTVGTMSAPAIGADFSYFVFKFSVTTIATGRINVKQDGVPIIGDQPSGYIYSTAAVLTEGIENNRAINATDYAFMIETSGSTITTVSIETDTAWAGKIDNISLQLVTPTKFAVAGAGTDPGKNNPVGIKVGAYNRNDMAFGDKMALGMFQFDGLPQTPAHNLAVGAKALATNQHGDQNTAIGTFSLQYNETSNNTAVGYSALKLNTKGRELAAVGYKALTSNTIGYRNSALGFWALGLNSVGHDCVAIGWYAGRNQLVGDYNTYIGSQAGAMQSGGIGGTFLGALAGYGTGNDGFSYNNGTGVGFQAQAYGNDTVSIGASARVGAVGLASTGSIAVGANSVATGAAPSVAIGSAAQATGDRSIAIGESVITLGGQGVSVGALSEARGNGTTSIGAQAGKNNTGSSNTFIGNLAGSLASNAFVNVTLLGAGTAVTGSNQVQLGDASTTTYAYGAIQNRSDMRDKIGYKKITEEQAVSFISGLVAYRGKFNYREAYREVSEDGTVTYAVNDGSRAGKRDHDYFLAQQVNELCERLGMPTFGGLQHHEINGGEDVWSLGYTEFVPMLATVLQHCLKRLDAQDAKQAEFEKRLVSLEVQKLN